MMSHMQKLEAKLEMFRFSLEYDVTSYAVQASKGISESETQFPFLLTLAVAEPKQNVNLVRVLMN